MYAGILNEVIEIIYPLIQKVVKRFKMGRQLLFNSPVRIQMNPPTTPLVHNSPLKYPIIELSQKYEGKLLTRSEMNLHDDVVNTLMNHSLFTSVKPIQKSTFLITCTRCNNRQHDLFSLIPCFRCRQTHYYCRNCINMGRIMECEPLYYWSGPPYLWPKHENACTWSGTLTNAQKNAADKITEAIRKNEELLVWAVTGAGKTEMLFPGITIALKEGKRICIATPRTDVVLELMPRIQSAFQGIPIQALYSGSKDNDGTAQLIIATTHQLLRYRQAFDVLIIDEIDAFPYHQDTSLQFAASRARKRKAALIYLTATPRKKQKRLLAFKQLLHVFVPLRYHGHPLPTPRFIYCSSLRKHLETKTMPKPFIHWLLERKNPNRQILLFVPTIELAKQLKQTVTVICLDQKFISDPNEIMTVHAEDPLRAEKIKLFRKQVIQLLITTTILERGVTFPSIDVVILDAGHQIFDEAALIQIAGRAGRSSVDPTGDVIFLHDGKTNAMENAIGSIQSMNRRGKKFFTGGESK